MENIEKHRLRAKKHYQRNKKRKNEQKIAWRLKYPEKAALFRRRSMLKRIYGLSLEDYDNMVEQQNEVCGICGKVVEGNLLVDHCHATRKIRGLLCNNCNLGLGYFRDNLDILASATSYLLNIV